MTIEEYVEMVTKACKNTNRDVPKEFDSGFARYNKYKSTIMPFKGVAAAIRNASYRLEQLMHDENLKAEEISLSTNGVTVYGTDLTQTAIIEKIQQFNDDIMYATTLTDINLFTILANDMQMLSDYSKVINAFVNSFEEDKSETNIPCEEAAEALATAMSCDRVVNAKDFIVKMVGSGKMSENDIMYDAVAMVDILDKTNVLNDIGEFKRWLSKTAFEANALITHSQMRCSDAIDRMNKDETRWEEAFNLYKLHYDELNMLSSYVEMIFNKYADIKSKAPNDQLITSLTDLFDKNIMTHVLASVWFVGSISDNESAYHGATFDLDYIKTLTEAYVSMSNKYGTSSFRTSFITPDGRTADITGLPKKIVAMMIRMFNRDPDMDIDECRHMAIEAYNNSIDE